MSTVHIVQYLSPAQTAAALGVTVRALRIYEQKGLVRPLRSEAGWRAYGPEALARLHQVLTLKRLGLSLAKIAVLISGRLSKLDSVLELQEQVLTRRRDESQHGLKLIAAARARIAWGGTFSLDDLTTLTRETTMKDEMPDWARKMQPIIDKHLNTEEKAAITAQAGAFDQAKIGAEWEDIIDKAKSLVGSDPSAPEALNIARRWRAQVLLSTGGDLSITAKMGEAWRESLASPDVAPTLPFGPDVWAFVSQAMTHLPPIA